MKRLLFLVGVVVVSACGSDSAPVVVAPTPIIPACQSQNTATVYFQNRSASNLTYDVLWDGSKLTTVAPGKDSQVYTFAANIPHTLRFQFTNTSLAACNQSTPVLTICTATFYGCGT